MDNAPASKSITNLKNYQLSITQLSVNKTTYYNLLINKNHLSCLVVKKENVIKSLLINVKSV